MENSSSWICTVCGYIHHDIEPPDVCPVCGVGKEFFKPYSIVPVDPEPEKTEKWRCLNCEYIHEGESPPETCPVCAAPSDKFEMYSFEKSKTLSRISKIKIVIVGAGIAGISASESVRKISAESEIFVISKESALPYYRLNLTRYLAGEIDENELYLHPEQWYKDNNISLLLDTELTSIDTSNKILTLHGNEEFSYDTLIMAVGSHPYIPPIPGIQKENVTALRTKRNADFIKEQRKSCNDCVIAGGGILGLETAGALAKNGSMKVTLLEGHRWILPRQLNEKGAAILERHLFSLGITVYKQVRLKEVYGDEKVREVLLDNGRRIQCDLLVVTTGVRSNSYIARLAGLDVNRGVIVNNNLQTSLPDIYAAGDVTEHRGIQYGTWGPSQFQGTIAGNNACGNPIEFAGIPRSNILKVLGVDMFSIGQIISEDASFQELDGIIDGHYYYFLFRDNCMTGAILLGDTKLSAKVKQIIENRTDCYKLLQNISSLDLAIELIKACRA